MLSRDRRLPLDTWNMSDPQKISELQSDKFPTLATFFMLEDKIQISRILCYGSKKLRWSIQWMNSNLRDKLQVRIFRISSCWTRELYSALNKIIQNSYFKKKVSLEEQKAQNEDRFLRGRQTAYMIYDYFRVTGAHDSVLDYADLFSIILRNDDVQAMFRASIRDGMMFWKVCSN